MPEDESPNPVLPLRNPVPPIPGPAAPAPRPVVPVVIVDYDPAWPEAFARLRDRAAAALGPVARRIEHVGSTSVPGLAAKPVIDLTVVVAAPGDVPEAIRRLAGIGYQHQGDQGIPGREAFSSPPGPPVHHLYVCAEGNRELRRHLLFRDYLRVHPETARQYGDLKRALAERYRTDRDGYSQAKTDFVEGVLREAVRWAGIEDAGDIIDIPSANTR